MNRSFTSPKSKENLPVKDARQKTLFDMFKSKTSDSPKADRNVLGDESNRKSEPPVSEIKNLKIEESSKEPLKTESIETKVIEETKSSSEKNDTVEIIEIDGPTSDAKSTSPKSESKKEVSPKPASDKTESVKTDESNVDKVELKKLKIYNFFVRVPQNEVAAAKAKIFNDSGEVAAKTQKEELKLQKELETKKKLEKPYLLGKRVFDAGDDEKKFIIQNHMFGDLASIVEFYNTFSSIYDNKTKFKYVNKRDKIEFTKIKFDDLVNMLNDNMSTHQSRMYYSKLIESLLKILLKYESVYEKYALFETNLMNIELENNLQDLCRMVTTLIFKEHHENEIAEKDLLLPDELEEERHKILKELRTNKENDLFLGMSVESRLELLTLFCEQVLYGENFLKQKEFNENKVENLRAHIRELKAKMKEEYDFALTARAYDKDKNVKIPKEILEDEKKKNQFMKAFQKLKDEETKLKSSEFTLNKFSRIEPLSVDSNGFLYWHFSCMNGIILEKRSAVEDSDEVKSEWYSFTTMEEMDNLISLLQHEPENAKLVNGLKRKYEKIFGQKSKLELAQTKKEVTNDIGKMFSGETEAKKTAEAPKVSMDESFQEEKKHKFLTVEEFDEEAEEKPTGQFVTRIDKLLERILNNRQKGVLNEEEFVAKKNSLISSFFEGEKSFDEKFSFIKARMVESLEGFLNDGHLKAEFTEDKMDLWKKCVEQSESLSNLYLLNFLFVKQINWQAIKQKKKVDIDDDDDEFKTRRRMARDEFAEDRPYSLRTLKKVNYDADEQLDKMIEEQSVEEEPMEMETHGDQDHEEEEEEGDAAADDDDDSDADVPEAESESEYEAEESEEDEPKPQRRSTRSKRGSSSPEDKENSGRRSHRLKAKPEEEDTGRRRSARLSKHD